MTRDEQFVRKFFQWRWGLVLTKIPESNTEKRPDFECQIDSVVVFVCELKTLEDVEPSKEAGWEIEHDPEFDITSASRDCNAVNRVATIVCNAQKQLITRTEPRVLTILNDDHSVDITDFFEAIRGWRRYASEDGSVSYINEAAKPIARGRFEKLHGDIDLYVWINRHDGNKAWLRYISERGRDLGIKVFGETSDAPAEDQNEGPI